MRSAEDLRSLTGDRRQVASVRRIMLDEGPERGLAALAFSTGGGLDFWVLADRALDIGPLWWRGMPVAWQSPAGFRHPSLVDPEEDGGRGFERAFSGFLMTCGLDHTRQPVDGRPMHGRLHALPARVEAHGEAWEGRTPMLFCEGTIRQWRQGHENLSLRRRIEAPIGETTLTIKDSLRNEGRAPQRISLLYHLNVGHPFLVPGAKVVGQDPSLAMTMGEPEADSAPEARSAAALGDPAEWLLERPDGASLSVSFGRDGLPFAQIWRDPRPGSYVMALEPCTDARGEDGVTRDPVVLAPGETRSMALSVTFRAPA